MINKETYETTVVVGSTLAARGLIVTAKPNTVLSELVRLSVPTVDVTATTAANTEISDPFISEAEAVYWHTAGDIDTPSEHDKEISGYITDISRFVNSHISNAKNIVNPLVTEFAETIAKYRQDNSLDEPSKKFNIIVLNIPTILKDDFFLDSIANFKDRSILAPEKTLTLSTRTPEELSDLIMSGDKKTDQYILEWLATLDGDFLSKVWNNLFTSNPINTNPISDEFSGRILGFSDISNSLNIYDKANVALAILLLSRKLEGDVIDENLDMSLAEYKGLVSQYELYSAALLSFCIGQKMLSEI